MATIALDTTKLLGFRIGQTGTSKTGIKLGSFKEGGIKAT